MKNDYKALMIMSVLISCAGLVLVLCTGCSPEGQVPIHENHASDGTVVDSMSNPNPMSQGGNQSEESDVTDPVESENTESFGGLKGVVQTKSGEPIAMVSLAFTELRIGAASGSDGAYNINNIPVGNHVLTATNPSYHKELKVEVFLDSVVVLDVVFD